MSADPFSLSEFSEFLEDSDGHRLAEFLRKKNGGERLVGRRIFNTEPERFSLNVRVRRVSTPPAPPREVPNELVGESKKIAANETSKVQNNDCNHQVQEILEKEAIELPDKSVQPPQVVVPIGIAGGDTIENVDHILQVHEIKKEEAIDLPDNSAEAKNPESDKVCDPKANNPAPIEADEENIDERDEDQEIPQPRATAKGFVANASKKPGESILLSKQPSLPRPHIIENQRQCDSPLPPASLPATPRSIRFQSPRSPISKVMRSGGVSSADKLRRQVLKRRSSMNNPGKRTLLKEFESTISSSEFSPQLFSTPMKTAEDLPCSSQAKSQHLVENPAANSLSKQDQEIIKSMVERALEESIKKLKAFQNIEEMETSGTSEPSASKLVEVANAPEQIEAPPNSSKNAIQLPETQELLQQAQAQTSSRKHLNASIEPFTQELLQEVQHALNDIRKSQSQVPKIVIPVNQTFNNTPTAPTSQCDRPGTVQNLTDCEETLTGAMVQNSADFQLDDTLTKTHTQTSNCNKSHLFVNHPTFTQNNETTNKVIPMDFDGSQIKLHTTQKSNRRSDTVLEPTPIECCTPALGINQSTAVSRRDNVSLNTRTFISRQQNSAMLKAAQTNKVTETFRVHTHNECCVRHSTHCNVTNTNKASETFKVHSHNADCTAHHTQIEDSIKRQQNATTAENAKQADCCSPQRTRIHDSINRQQNLIHLNPTINNKVAETVRTNAQHDCCSPHHSSRQQNSTKLNATNKASETCREHTHSECLSPARSIVQDPAVTTKDKVPMEPIIHVSLPRNSLKQNTTVSKKGSETFREQAQIDCASTSLRTIIQDQALSTSRQQNITRLNATNTNKTAETVKEYSNHECRSSPCPMVQVPAASITTNAANANRKSINTSKPTERSINSAHATVSSKNATVTNDEIAVQMNNNKSAALPRRSILKNRNPQPETQSSEEARHENNNVANSSLITEDEDDFDVSNIPVNRKTLRKSGPLNLAPERRKPIRRSKRKRICTKAPTSTTTFASPLITSDTETDSGPPRAHPLNLRHSRQGEEYILQQKQLKRVLNKPPNTPKNGERFADELKSHLARLTNHEILDLRKRNSMGEGLIAPTHLGKSSADLKLTLKRHLQIEEQIQLEILRRQLLGEAEGLHEAEEQNVNDDGEEDDNDDREVDDMDIVAELNGEGEVNDNDNVAEFNDDEGEMNDNDNVAEFNDSREVEEIDIAEYNELPSAPDVFKDNNTTKKTTTTKTTQQIMAELTELPSAPDVFKDKNTTQKTTTNQQNMTELNELPSAPDAFKDNDTTQKVTTTTITNQQILMNLTTAQSYTSSLIDDDSRERVTFIQPSQSSVSQPRRSRSRKKYTEEMPEITKRYIEIQKRVKKRRKPNTSKRSLYTKGDSTVECEESPENVSSEKENFPQTSTAIKPIPPPPLYNSISTVNNLRIPSPPPPLAMSPTPRRQRRRRPSPLPSPILSPTPHRVAPSTPRQLRFTSELKRKSSLPPPPPIFATTSKRATTPSPLSPPPPPQSPTSPHSSQSTSPTPNCIPPPAPFLDNVRTNNSINNTTLSASRINTTKSNTAACQTEDDLFKKPTMPAPRRNQRKKKVTTTTRVETSSSTESNETHSTDEEGVRRSKRGLVPRKQSFLCGTKDGPPLVYSLYQAAERRTALSKLKRLERMQVSTTTKGVRGRPSSKKSLDNEEVMHSYLGDTNTTSGTIYNTKDGMTDNTTRNYRLEAIEETPSESDGEMMAATENRRGGANTQQASSDSDAPAIATNKQNKQTTKTKVAKNTKKSRPPKSNTKSSEEKNKKQKRKTKAVENNLKTTNKDNTAATTITTNTAPTTSTQINAENHTMQGGMTTADRLGLLELSRVNGPPPPPRDKLNEIFDQLKNAAAATNAIESTDTAHSDSAATSSSSATASSRSTSRTRNVRVRLRRLNNNSNNGATSSALSSSDQSTTNTTTTGRYATTQAGAQNELFAWLKNVSNSCEASSSKDIALFREMRTSTAGHLYFTDLEGIDYAFYDTADKGSLGYLRFQPLQHKPSKRAKKYNLHFVVLAGTFRIGTENEHGTFGVGDMVAINTGQRYNITNMENDVGILMVIKK